MREIAREGIKVRYQLEIACFFFPSSGSFFWYEYQRRGKRTEVRHGKTSIKSPDDAMTNTVSPTSERETRRKQPEQEEGGGIEKVGQARSTAKALKLRGAYAIA